MPICIVNGFRIRPDINIDSSRRWSGSMFAVQEPKRNTGGAMNSTHIGPIRADTRLTWQSSDHRSPMMTLRPLPGISPRWIDMAPTPGVYLIFTVIPGNGCKMYIQTRAPIRRAGYLLQLRRTAPIEVCEGVPGWTPPN